ncbi:hypothetical protein Curi_c16120 [Gottschalkia acidurici 9a]|uniref:DUF3787 domain-containing protein n=1 Tax=Gottschalkia acidurici (strain ATCC 7906 / DSM 604 / BCRC 14475 / CIP 104303 / KCTC 5404 / NCIMB 10678 / 9a) TaxID=1128398 RepID=K0B109_GOTA9|nr:DUF3787 domain-containing protein [Gottschalkia acidurici]AFS78620.1 hypothetical protein Curi_c16120 [Gottschalkia acidurici 9a]
MTKDNVKNNTCNYVNRKKNNSQIESHETAAWAEIEKQETEAKVPVPSLENVEEAKEWVEENKK